MTAILAILSKVWGFITSKGGEWLGIGAAILASVAVVRKSGADSVRMKQDEQTLKDVGIKNEIDTKIDNMSDADAVNELHSKWRR